MLTVWIRLDTHYTGDHLALGRESRLTVRTKHTMSSQTWYQHLFYLTKINFPFVFNKIKTKPIKFIRVARSFTHIEARTGATRCYSPFWTSIFTDLNKGTKMVAVWSFEWHDFMVLVFILGRVKGITRERRSQRVKWWWRCGLLAGGDGAGGRSSGGKQERREYMSLG